MDTMEFLDLCYQEIKNADCFHNNDETNDDLKVIIVWANHTIQNNKAMLIVRNIKYDFIYPKFIEATYNGDAKELYLDFYEKQFKHIVKVGD